MKNQTNFKSSPTDLKSGSSPIATSGSGSFFENQVQAYFTTLMLTNNVFDFYPDSFISKIKLQGKNQGYNTDDMIVHFINRNTKDESKILCQIKKSIKLNTSDSKFKKIITDAWKDINNRNKFTIYKDIVLVVTNQLSINDKKCINFLNKYAKSAENSCDFISGIKQKNFSPPKCSKKLEAIKMHLMGANNGNNLTNDELQLFFKHFFVLEFDLGCELSIRQSGALSFLQSCQINKPQFIWSKIIESVQNINEVAGTVSWDSLPKDLLAEFSNRKPLTMSDELNRSNSLDESHSERPSDAMEEKPYSKITLKSVDWAMYPNARFLAQVSLIGAWDGGNKNDIGILNYFFGSDYNNWLNKAIEICDKSGSPLSTKDGIWLTKNRKELLQNLGRLIVNDDIENFMAVTDTVLGESDPALDLPKEQRFTALLADKNLKYSNQLRNGISGGLALIGNQYNSLKNCSSTNVKNYTIMQVRKLLENQDWKSWCSLRNLLPNLAEASPEEFLYQVNNTILNNPECIDKIFEQEGEEVFGNNYMVGLLWAIEALAWNENYLVNACNTLGELTRRDPGGIWSNRPFNSIVTILLPWSPQTLANFEKQKVAVKTLLQENNEVGWNLLLNLLPNKHLMSTGTYKPHWGVHDIENLRDRVSVEEYNNQIEYYSDLAIKYSTQNTSRIAELIKDSKNLTNSALERLFGILSTDKLKKLPDLEKKELWSRLKLLVAEQKKFQNKESRFSKIQVERFESLVDYLAPQSAFYHYQYLFVEREDELLEKFGNWNEQIQELKRYRISVIKEVYEEVGLEGLVKFAGTVDSPRKVGYSISDADISRIDNELLPDLLLTDDKKLKKFVSSYILARQKLKGWKWVENCCKSNWKKEQIGVFFSSLPFEDKTWELVHLWLKNEEAEYWSIANFDFLVQAEDPKHAVLKLIQYDRPQEAMRYLIHMMNLEKTFECNLIIKVLLSCMHTEQNQKYFHKGSCLTLIEKLQSDPNVSFEELVKIEWLYLGIFDEDCSVKPKTLEQHLAISPEFYCELIQKFFNSSKQQKYSSKRLPPNYVNVFSLLENWKTLPGKDTDNKLNPEKFINWLNHVKKNCKDSRHLDIAHKYLGKALVNCPKDDDGFWINRTIARVLNHKEHDQIRAGYYEGIVYGGGAITVDHTGEREEKLALQYYEKANKTENEGFFRIATTLRIIAKQYEREAERNKNMFT